MASGDAAAAAGYTIVSGSAAANTLDDLINNVLDYLANKTGNASAAIPVSKGGTGATSAAAARTALGLEIATTLASTTGKIAGYSAGGQIGVNDPTSSVHATPRDWVLAQIAAAAGFNGGTVTGQIYLPNSFAATSGYTIAYINGDGRISRGASSRRYKKFISAAGDMGDLFPTPLQRFQMRQGDGSWRYGYIAEDLVGTDAEPFVVFQTAADEEGTFVVTTDDNGDPIPESIDFVGLLLAQVAQLNARITELEENARAD